MQTLTPDHDVGDAKVARDLWKITEHLHGRRRVVFNRLKHAVCTLRASSPGRTMGPGSQSGLPQEASLGPGRYHGRSWQGVAEPATDWLGKHRAWR